MKIYCPRCKSDNITKVENKIPVGNMEFPLTNQKCTECETVFYFEEQVISYIHSLSNSAVKP